MRKALLAVAALMMLSSTAARAEDYCGDLKTHFGPFDYRKRETQYANELYLVHSAHFSHNVENGIKGNSATLAGEIEYTLRVFPNHIRALNALDRIDLRRKAIKTGLEESRYPVECYFERAVRFAPDDGDARAAYGTYLFERGKVDASLKMFIEAQRLSPEDAAINYNLALLYVKTKDYDKANLYGKKAYKLGYPLPGLKNQLIAAGKWDGKAE